MESLTIVQGVLFWGLGLFALGLQAYALLDATRQRADAYPATSNQTKPIWLGILGVAVAIGVVSLPTFLSPLNIFNLLAIVAAGVYLARVRPAIRSITGNGPRNQW